MADASMRLVHRGAYPPDWKEIAERVKREAAYRCLRCGHPSDGHGANRVADPARRGRLRALCDQWCTHERDDKQRVLTIHLLDGNKSNCRWWNLLPLCQVDHLIIQAKLIPERPWLLPHTPWFEPYAAGFYASHYGGVEITRGEAERDLDRWLALGQPWRSELPHG